MVNIRFFIPYLVVIPLLTILLFVGFTIQSIAEKNIERSEERLCAMELKMMVEESMTYFILKQDKPDYAYAKPTSSKSGDYTLYTETGVYLGYHKAKWENYGCDRFYDITVNQIFFDDMIFNYSKLMNNGKNNDG